MSDTSVSILDALGEFEAIDLSADLLGGPNLRLRAGQNTFSIESRTGYVALPDDALALMRYTVSTQSDMPVIRATIGVRGESIGLLGDEDVRIPLPCYSQPAFATWRQWVHLVNVEFMNPDADAVAQLQALTLDAGFVPYVPRTVVENPQPRKSETLFDREPAGRTINARFEKGIRLDSCVIVPDLRVEPSVTEYTDRNGATVRRPAFTSFIDTIVPNMATALKAAASGDSEAKRTAFNRLSVLTGHDAESDWPQRPTLGYLTPKGGEEINLFGDRSSSSDGVEAAAAEVSEEIQATSATEVKTTTETPFGE